MINQKIVEYIQQNIDAGYDVDAIRKRLIDHGYPQNDIDGAINHVQQQSKANQTINGGSSKFARFRAKFSPGFAVAILILAAITAGLSFLIISNNSNNFAEFQNADRQMLTGVAVATEPDIYEDVPQVEQQVENETIENQKMEQEIQIKTGEEYYDELVNDEPPKENINIEEFKFSPESIVSTQNNISLSIDNIKHEIKSEYWGKIIEITATILNKGSIAFKPKLLVLLYDEKDFKEEWLNPKAEIQFDIDKLNRGEHTTRQAIVSISFDDIHLTKNFKLVLVDAADPANKPLVVADSNFEPLKN